MARLPGHDWWRMSSLCSTLCLSQQQRWRLSSCCCSTQWCSTIRADERLFTQSHTHLCQRHGLCYFDSRSGIKKERKMLFKFHTLQHVHESKTWNSTSTPHKEILNGKNAEAFFSILSLKVDQCSSFFAAGSIVPCVCTYCCSKAAKSRSTNSALLRQLRRDSHSFDASETLPPGCWKRFPVRL